MFSQCSNQLFYLVYAVDHVSVCDVLASLFKFVKDWWPVMVAGILAIFGPILGPGAWVVGVGASRSHKSVRPNLSPDY